MGDRSSRTRLMIRILSIIFAALSLFWFPWPLTIALIILAAAYEPIAATGLGILADVLYFAHGSYAFPYMTLIGLIITIAAIFVRKFVEARIIQG